MIRNVAFIGHHDAASADPSNYGPACAIAVIAAKDRSGDIALHPGFRAQLQVDLPEDRDGAYRAMLEQVCARVVAFSNNLDFAQDGIDLVIAADARGAALGHYIGAMLMGSDIAPALPDASGCRPDAEIGEIIWRMDCCVDDARAACR